MTDHAKRQAPAKDRLSKWRKTIYLPQSFTGPDTGASEALRKIASKPHPSGFWPNDDEGFSIDVFYQSARELIFDVVNGKEVIHFVCYSIDPSTVQVAIDHLLETVDATDDDIRTTLAYAFIYEIPVYPNTPELNQRLIAHYKRLFTGGFKAKLEDKDVTLRLVDAPNDRFDTLNLLKHLRPDRQYPSVFLTHIDGLYSSERIELGFAAVRESLDRADEADLGSLFSLFACAINVLKHGRGRSYDTLIGMGAGLPFRIKPPGENLLSEGDVSEVATLIDVDDLFVRECARLIARIAEVIDKNYSIRI